MSLDASLDALRESIGHARALGLDPTADRASTVLDSAETRRGFLGSTYVLALVGGTGVGKSSLLNTIAGRPVSPVSAIRPTTDQPLAWVAASRAREVGPLLEWLGVSEVNTHGDDDLEQVAILDMPDLDSVALEHRHTVDRLLPKVDAVLWVLDPEKYDDERLHSYLRRLGARAEGVEFALNKIDRLDPADQTAIVDDLVQRLTDDGVVDAVIYPVSALTGAGTAALRESLESEADAKAVVVDKLVTDVLSSMDRLAEEVGVADGYEPLLGEASREGFIARSVTAALDVIDPSGVARQLRASLVSRASIRAGSVLSRLVWLVRWITGHRRRHADPIRYLLTWRNRGALGRVVNPIRQGVLEAIRALPAASRPSLGVVTSGENMEEEIEKALDRAVDESAKAVPDRTSWVWSSLAVLQLLATAGFVFAVAWYLTLILGPGDLLVGTVDVPYLGPVPMPLALLAGSLLASLLVAGLARAHASWLGVRESRRLRSRISEAVSAAVMRSGFGRLDEVERSRRAIAELRASATLR